MVVATMAPILHQHTVLPTTHQHQHHTIHNPFMGVASEVERARVEEARAEARAKVKALVMVTLTSGPHNINTSKSHSIVMYRSRSLSLSTDLSPFNNPTPPTRKCYSDQHPSLSIGLW